MLTYVKIKPIDLLLSREQKQKSTMYQVVLLIQNHKDFLEVRNKMAKAIFVNLTAAYDNAIAYKLGFN